MKALFLVLLLGLSGCSHLILVKDCKEIKDSPEWRCKTLKPWE